MTARRYVITRKSDGAFWAGMFGFVGHPQESLVFGSLRAAFAELREMDAAPNGEHEPDCFVEPFNWYLSILYPEEL